MKMAYFLTLEMIFDNTSVSDLGFGGFLGTTGYGTTISRALGFGALSFNVTVFLLSVYSSGLGGAWYSSWGGGDSSYMGCAIGLGGRRILRVSFFGFDVPGSLVSI